MITTWVAVWTTLLTRDVRRWMTVLGEQCDLPTRDLSPHIVLLIAHHRGQSNYSIKLENINITTMHS